MNKKTLTKQSVNDIIPFSSIDENRRNRTKNDEQNDSETR